MSKAVFLKPLCPKTERFLLSELGPDASVTIRELPAKALLDLQKKYGDETTGLTFAADFLSVALVDEDGHPLFASPEECLDHVSNLPVAGLDRLLMAALRLSGMSGRVVEEPEKN